MSKNPSSIRLKDADWLVLESLSGRKFNHAATISLVFGDGDTENVNTILASIRAKVPGLAPEVSDAVRVSLHEWKASGEAVYFVSVSALVRDALAWYARKLSPKVLTGDGVSTPSPVTA